MNHATGDLHIEEPMKMLTKYGILFVQIIGYSHNDHETVEFE